MRVLMACECSGIVRDELRKLGHDAWSCDIIPCERDPQWHIHDDVLKHLNDGWDMMIAFPPCTHLAVSGAAWFAQKRKDGRQQEGIDFFMRMVNANIPKIVIENPVGIMSRLYRKPDQIIQPYHFGHTDSKKTCLWLKNTPPPSCRPKSCSRYGIRTQTEPSTATTTENGTQKPTSIHRGLCSVGQTRLRAARTNLGPARTGRRSGAEHTQASHKPWHNNGEDPKSDPHTIRRN